MIWKDFFYYSKGERKGVVILIIILFIIMISRMLVNTLVTEQNQTINNSESVISEINEFHKNLKAKRYYNYKFDHNHKIQPRLFDFDPNTADSMDFIELGLRPFMASNILKYRKKGGVFKKQTDFAKIYGLSTSEYTKLSSFIKIDESRFRKRDSLLYGEHHVKDSAKYYKYPIGTVIDINKADTTEFKKIPAIGIGFALRFINYRRELGGYVNVAQIHEVYGMTDSLYNTLSAWFKVETPVIQKILINKAGIEKLNAHPYINFYQAKVIVEYRMKRGRINHINDLRLFQEFSKNDFIKLEPYLSYE